MWLALAALYLGACPSSDEPEMPAAGSGSAGTAANGGKGGESAAAGTGGSTAAAGSGGGAKQSSKGLHGAFTLSLVSAREATAESAATPARTSFLGLVNDGEKPSPNAWLEEQSAVGCKLYTPVSPLCDPSCGSSAACVSDGVCAPYPKSQPVGTIKLTGVGDAPIEMSPVGSGNNYQPKAGTVLPYPPCDEGADLSLAVEGGTYTSFDLKTKCIAPLDFQGPIKLVKAMPLKLTWNVPKEPDQTRIQIKLNISHHGGSRGEIRCDVDDNGMLELPASMVDRLVELGVAGFPTIVLARVATGNAVGGEPADVQLIVNHNVERAIEIDGLVSCSESQHCPTGQTCQSDLTCK